MNAAHLPLGERREFPRPARLLPPSSSEVSGFGLWAVDFRESSAAPDFASELSGEIEYASEPKLQFHFLLDALNFMVFTSSLNSSSVSCTRSALTSSPSAFDSALAIF